jgi:hypothetical protein
MSTVRPHHLPTRLAVLIMKEGEARSRQRGERLQGQRGVSIALLGFGIGLAGSWVVSFWSPKVAVVSTTVTLHAGHVGTDSSISTGGESYGTEHSRCDDSKPDFYPRNVFSDRGSTRYA